MQNLTIHSILLSIVLTTQTVLAIDDPYQTADPQPLNDAILSCQPPSPAPIVDRLVAAVGGEAKLLRLFRTRETVNVSSDPEKKVAPRVSVYEPPNYWWTGKNERVKNETMPDEPATFLVWAWTLGILVMATSRIVSPLENGRCSCARPTRMRQENVGRRMKR